MKRRGVFGTISDIFWYIILAGIFLAFLSMHNFDIVATIYWILMKIWDIILIISKFLLENELFRKITTS